MGKKYFLCTDGIVRSQEQFKEDEDAIGVQVDQTYMVDTAYTKSTGLNDEDIANQIYYLTNGGQTPEWLSLKRNNNWKGHR